MIHYVSRQLSGPRLKWAAVEAEAYAVVHALLRLRCYIYGEDVTVITDHKPLLSLFSQQMKNTKIQRWSVLIAEYGAKIQYRKGPNNIRADMLSRIRATRGESDRDYVSESNSIRYSKKTGRATLMTFGWTTSEKALRERLLQADRLRARTLAKSQKTEFPDAWEEAMEETETGQWMLIDGLLYTMAKMPQLGLPRLVIPKAGGARKRIIERAHADAGHMGAMKTTYLRIRPYYYWKQLRKDVEEIVSNCPTCALHSRRHNVTKMSEMPIPSFPFEVVGMDLIGPFVETDKGNRYALVLVDHLTSWPEVIPIPSKSAAEVQRAWQEVVSRHGCPMVTITDRGSELKNAQMAAWFHQSGIEHRATTALRPQTNGRTERTNKTVKMAIEKAVSNRPRKWEEVLPSVLLAIRTTPGVTGQTPFYLMTGRDPILPSATHVDGVPEVQWLKELEENRIKAQIAIDNSRKYNRARLCKTTGPEFRNGQLVLLQAPPDRLTFTTRWDSGYRVIKVAGPVVTIRHTSGKTLVVNRARLQLSPVGGVGRVRRPRRVQKKRN